jgi:hypothetical protein
MQDFRRLMISATFKSELFKSFVSAFDLSTYSYIMHNIILRRISHKISTGEVNLFVPSPEIEGRNAVEYIWYILFYLPADHKKNLT